MILIVGRYRYGMVLCDTFIMFMYNYNYNIPPDFSPHLSSFSSFLNSSTFFTLVRQQIADRILLPILDRYRKVSL